MQLKDILLVCDMDGTLIDSHFEILTRNCEALAHYQELGGHFTIATGRTKQSAGQYFSQIYPDVPCILLNGTILYDFCEHKIISSFSVSTALLPALLQAVAKEFPKVGLELFNTQEVAILRRNRYVKNSMTPEVLMNPAEISAFPQPWCKALLGCNPEEMPELKAFVQAQPHNGLEFVLTSPAYLEIVPEGVNKGSTLQILMKKYGFSPKAVFAIGDYENDREMLKTAGFAAVPADGQPSLQHMANLVTCPCGNGAVAELADNLMKRYG